MAIETKNIIYKVGVDVFSAKKGINDLDKLTKKLESTSKKAAQTERGIAKTAEQASKRRIKNIKDSEKAIKRLRKERDKAFDPDKIREFDQAINKTKRDIDSLKGTTKKAGSQMGNFGGIVTKVGGILAATFAIDRIGSFIAESIKLANETKNVSLAFGRLNGSIDILRRLRAATSDTVNDLSLMKGAVQANNFRVPLEQLAKFFEFASRRAAETGESVDFMVDSIVKGVGFKSVRRLDNLGISLVSIQDELKKTADFGEAIGNIIDVELGKATTSIDEGARSTQRLATQMENLQVIIGSKLAPTTNAWLANLADGIKSASLLLDGASFEARNFGDTLETAQAKLLKTRQQFAAQFPGGDNGGAGAARFVELIERGEEYVRVLQKVQEINLLAAESEEGLAKAIILTKDELDNALKSYDIGEIQVDRFREKLDELTKTYNSQRTAAFNTISSEEDYRQKLSESQNQLALVSEEFGVNSSAAKKLRSEIDKLKSAFIVFTDGGDISAVSGNLFDLTQKIEALSKEQGLANTTLERTAEINAELIELNKQRAELLGQVTNKVKELNKVSTDAALKAQNQLALILLENAFLEEKLQTQSQDDILELTKKYEADKLDLAVKGLEARLLLLPKESKEYADLYNQILNLEDKFLKDLQKNIDDAGPFTIPIDIAGAGPVSTPDDFQKLKDEEIEIALAASEAIADIYSNLSQYQQSLYESDLAALQRQFDEKEITEQQFAAQSADLKRQQAVDQKQAAIIQATISVAQGVAAQYQAGPTGIALAALVAVAGAAQIALIAAQPIPQFAEGVIGLEGPGTGTSDSIPSMLSKGESVMTAKETSQHGDMFEAIRNNTFDDFAKHNIIDPVMMGMQIQGHKSEQKRESKFDDYRLFRAIKGNSSIGVKNSDDIGRSVARHMGNSMWIKNRYV